MCKSTQNAVKFKHFCNNYNYFQNTKQAHGDWGWFILILWFLGSTISVSSDFRHGFVTFAPPDPGLGRTREGSAASFLAMHRLLVRHDQSSKATGWRDQSSWVILKIWRSCVKLSGFVLQHRTVFHCYTPCCNVWIVPTLSTPVPSVCSNLSLPSGRISVCQISDHSFFRSLLIHPPSCRPTRFCIQSIRKRKGLRDEGSNFAVEASMELGWRAVVPLWLSCFLPVVPLIFSASDYSIPLVGPRRSQTSCWNRVYVYLFQTPHHSTAACLRF